MISKSISKTDRNDHIGVCEHDVPLGPEHANTLMSMDNVGVALSNQKKYAEAEVMYRRAMEEREKTLGPEHADTLTRH
jgi:hypothetical protein